MNINKMTRKEFEALPWRDKWDERVECDAMVILPTKRMHDSGYRCMDFVAVKGVEPLCRLSGSSDMLCIEGIGGYGLDWILKYENVPNLTPPAGWSIDCLPKSGLLRVFVPDHTIVCEAALPSFEIYSKKRNE